MTTDPKDIPVVIDARPPVVMSAHGDMDEAAAALYLTYRMRKPMHRPVTPRTLRFWRHQKLGPVYHKADGGRDVWYRVADIDEWLEITCAVDPLAA